MLSNTSFKQFPLIVTIPQAILSPHHEAVMRAILTDIQDVLSILTSSHPPLLPHTPPTTTRLLWLHALGERASGSVSVVRSAAPELLEGELGWKLRQTYSELTEKLHRLANRYGGEFDKGLVCYYISASSLCMSPSP